MPTGVVVQPGRSEIITYLDPNPTHLFYFTLTILPIYYYTHIPIHLFYPYYHWKSKVNKCNGFILTLPKKGHSNQDSATVKMYLYFKKCILITFRNKIHQRTCKAFWSADTNSSFKVFQVPEHSDFWLRESGQSEPSSFI